MKVERPVIYIQTVCDFCKRDIDGDEIFVEAKKVAPKGRAFFVPNPELDICEDCFAKLGKPPEPKLPEIFSCSGSYAITGSFYSYPFIT